MLNSQHENLEGKKKAWQKMASCPNEGANDPQSCIRLSQSATSSSITAEQIQEVLGACHLHFILAPTTRVLTLKTEGKSQGL